LLPRGAAAGRIQLTLPGPQRSLAGPDVLDTPAAGRWPGGLATAASPG